MIQLMLHDINEESRPGADEIKTYAYLIYEQEGRPAGRAHQHWREAEAQLWAMRLIDEQPMADLRREMQPGTRSRAVRGKKVGMLRTDMLVPSMHLSGLRMTVTPRQSRSPGSSRTGA